MSNNEKKPNGLREKIKTLITPNALNLESYNELSNMSYEDVFNEIEPLVQFIVYRDDTEEYGWTTVLTHSGVDKDTNEVTASIHNISPNGVISEGPTGSDAVKFYDSVKGYETSNVGIKNFIDIEDFAKNKIKTDNPEDAKQYVTSKPDGSATVVEYLGHKYGVPIAQSYNIENNGNIKIGASGNAALELQKKLANQGHTVKSYSGESNFINKVDIAEKIDTYKLNEGRSRNSKPSLKY